MHAAAFILLFASSVEAQVASSFKRLPALPASERSLLTTTESHEATPGDQYAMNESGHEMAHDSIVVQPEFMSTSGGRPYSQLAGVMNCSDCSSNLWSNYQSERAAIAARITRHVDGRCNCFACGGCQGGCRTQLHGQACSPCGSECGTGCGIGSGVVLNRYKQPFSSFYGEPSTACGVGCQAATCGTTCDTGVATPSCSSCGTNGIQTAKVPAAVNQNLSQRRAVQPNVPATKPASQFAGRAVAPDFGTAAQNQPAYRR